MNISSANVGLTANQLRQVFPYHVAVDESFQIIQLGNRLKEILPYKKILGVPIYDVFDIRSPSNCAFDWFQLTMNIESTFTINLKANLLSELKRKEIKSLKLKGKFIFQSQQELSDSVVSSIQGAIFLLHLYVNTDDLEGSNVYTNDITNDSSLQKDVIMNGTLKISYIKKINYFLKLIVYCFVR